MSQRSAACLGIIPARGGSKSIPRKNIKVLGGKPLIAWTIETALKSDRLGEVIVSTDDEEIAGVSRTWGAKVPFIRPSELGQDSTPTLPVLQHAVSWYEGAKGCVPDIIIVLQPTSPFRRAEHIDEAIKVMTETGADSVVSVCVAEHSPYWMKRLEGSRVFPFLNDAPEYTRRQDLPPVYRLNGAIYVSRCDVIMKQNRILGIDTRAVIMDVESSIDIDSNLDFRLAEILLADRTNE
jgi:CMP-N,N'-diacetyllegionaminic acid synthase